MLFYSSHLATFPTAAASGFITGTTHVRGMVIYGCQISPILRKIPYFTTFLPYAVSQIVASLR